MSEGARPEPPGVLVRQQALIEDIAQGLVAVCPETWTRVAMDLSAVEGFQLSCWECQLADGSTEQPFMPDGAYDAVDELREVMYAPGRGTWLSVHLEVSRTDGVSVDFNYDNEPAWDAPISPLHYEDELERFPRDEVPDWWRGRLAEAQEVLRERARRKGWRGPLRR